MKSNTDVLIIGGGAIGICSAYYLAQQGLRVSLVEKAEIASGCSGANAGLIVPSHIIPMAAPGVLNRSLKWMLEPESPFYIKPRFDLALFYWLWQFRKACESQQMHKRFGVLRDLNYASLELFDKLIAGESLTCNFRKDGWLMVYKTDQGFREALEEAPLLKSHDVELKILSTDETLEMAPMLRPDISGGIYYPQDSHLNPEKFVKALAERLRERGVVIRVQTEVLELETSDGTVKAVRTTNGDFKPNKVILAAGAWSPHLLKNLGFRLPVQPAKGYGISIKRPESCPDIPLYLSEAKVVVTPLEDVLRFAGTLELTGMDFNINLRRVDAIKQAAEDYLGQIEGLDLGEIWCGMRPCSPDGLPIIDRFPDFSNLIVATGHCMLGITMAPITGKLISQLVCEQIPDINLTPLSITRFK